MRKISRMLTAATLIVATVGLSASPADAHLSVCNKKVIAYARSYMTIDGAASLICSDPFSHESSIRLKLQAQRQSDCWGILDFGCQWYPYGRYETARDPYGTGHYVGGGKHLGLRIKHPCLQGTYRYEATFDVDGNQGDRHTVQHSRQYTVNKC